MNLFLYKINFRQLERKSCCSLLPLRAVFPYIDSIDLRVTTADASRTPMELKRGQEAACQQQLSES